ncbi:hypothetical protein E2C01_099088 [Portunus trituberculatus]|uniref:Uncharacterized protein n=1 Tax=Portunus trituberculatus TaxID=210409 RepID=A0A5B7KEI1_PORTR|nr:hypothetical protein [Portunus trituberculatus]
MSGKKKKKYVSTRRLYNPPPSRHAYG